MLQENGTSYHVPGPVDPARSKPATSEQRRAATKWARCQLGEISPAKLTKALAALSAHPDSQSAGYSTAKAAYARVAAELAGRATLLPPTP